MKYLVIAKKDQYGRWFAFFYERDVINALIYDILESNARDLATITASNYDTVVEGKLNADNISDIEPTMRQMGFRKCDKCGAWVTPQDIGFGNSVYTGGKRYCPTCWTIHESRHKKIELAGYHCTSDRVRVINGAGETFTLNDVLGLGFEAEYYNESGSDGYIKCTDTFYDIAEPGSINRMFRCERDGSVTGEIISNIFTKKSFNAFDCSIITDMLKLNGNIEGNTKAGLHVHLSKLWLGTTEKEQCLNFLKLQYFMKSYENDFLKLSGRRRDAMYYCEFFSHSEIENMKNNILNREHPWRYMPDEHGGCGCALNASNATIEFRIGANTNDPVRMKMFILFLLGITENIKNVPFEKCYCIGKVTRLVPNEVMNYWRKNGCFLTTNALDNRGVTLSA